MAPTDMPRGTWSKAAEMAPKGDWEDAITRPVTVTDARQNVVDWGWGLK